MMPRRPAGGPPAGRPTCTVRPDGSLRRRPVGTRSALTLGQVGAAALVVLVLTGVPLTFAYDPDGSGVLSGLHSMASALLVGSAAGILGAVVGSRVRRSGTWVGWPLAITGFVAAGAGAVSGQFVRWTGVRPPDDRARGLLGPLGGGVDAVVVGGGELSPTGFLVWALVHVVVVSVALGAVVRWFRRRSVAADLDRSPTCRSGQRPTRPRAPPGATPTTPPAPPELSRPGEVPPPPVVGSARDGVVVACRHGPLDPARRRPGARSSTSTTKTSRPGSTSCRSGWRWSWRSAASWGCRRPGASP